MTAKQLVRIGYTLSAAGSVAVHCSVAALILAAVPPATPLSGTEAITATLITFSDGVYVSTKMTNKQTGDPLEASALSQVDPDPIVNEQNQQTALLVDSDMLQQAEPAPVHADSDTFLADSELSNPAESPPVVENASAEVPNDLLEATAKPMIPDAASKQDATEPEQGDASEPILADAVGHSAHSTSVGPNSNASQFEQQSASLYAALEPLSSQADAVGAALPVEETRDEQTVKDLQVAENLAEINDRPGVPEPGNIDAADSDFEAMLAAAATNHAPFEAESESKTIDNPAPNLAPVAQKMEPLAKPEEAQDFETNESAPRLAMVSYLSNAGFRILDEVPDSVRKKGDIEKIHSDAFLPDTELADNFEVRHTFGEAVEDETELQLAATDSTSESSMEDLGARWLKTDLKQEAAHIESIQDIMEDSPEGINLQETASQIPKETSLETMAERSASSNDAQRENALLEKLIDETDSDSLLAAAELTKLATAEFFQISGEKADKAIEKQSGHLRQKQISQSSESTGTELAALKKPTADAGLVHPSYANDLHANRPPQYPVQSRSRGEQGTVILRVHVGKDGRAIRIETHQSSGFARLDKAAIKSVKKWRFTPATQFGIPIEGVVRIPFRFSLVE